MAVNPAAVAVPGLSSLAYSEGGGDVGVVECEDADTDSEGLLANEKLEGGEPTPVVLLKAVGDSDAVSSLITGRLSDTPRLGSALVGRGESNPDPDEEEHVDGEYGKCCRLAGERSGWF